MTPARLCAPVLLTLAFLAGPGCDKGSAKDGGKAAEAKGDVAKGDAAKGDGAEGDAAKAETKEEPKAEGGAKQGGDAKAAELHPSDAELAEKRKGDELEHDSAAVKAVHDKMTALLSEGRKLAEGGDLDGAIAKYEELLVIDPHYRPCLIELGEVEAKAENWPAAVHHTKLAAKLTSPDDSAKPMLLDRIGQYAEKEGKKDDAAHYYRESLKLAESAEVQARLDALGDVAPEEAIPEGPAGSVGSLHSLFHAKSVEDVCASYGEDRLCVPKECNFIAAEGEGDWGVFEVGDGVINCYHPAFRVADDDWVVYISALMDSHGTEVHQGVDRLELSPVEVEGIADPFLVISYADHLYERIWDEELGEDDVREDTIDAEGMIVCQRVSGGRTRCTVPIMTSVDFTIGDHSGKFSAKATLEPEAVVMSDVVKQGKADAAVRAYFDGVLLEPGPHTLPAPH